MVCLSEMVNLLYARCLNKVAAIKQSIVRVSDKHMYTAINNDALLNKITKGFLLQLTQG